MNKQRQVLFEAYKKQRKMLRQWLKQRLKGHLIWDSSKKGTYRKTDKKEGQSNETK